MKFKPGQVWEWGTWIYALMRKDESLFHTIYYENQESWYALNLETGAFGMITIHTSIFTDGKRWIRHF